MHERPKIHFTPARNWINDPNGLIFHEGLFHIYFQHNPFENKWGHMSWGHATSKDLINWQEMPIAIPEQADHAIFSGSAVFDYKSNRIAAFYTAHKEQNQSQHLAFSADGGNTYQLFESNPVLDLNLADFRDPKVFPFKDHWIMVVAKSKLLKLSFFKSTDLINWEFLSDYVMPGISEIYECPDLIEINGDWVLFLSTNPGGPAGGSGMHYVIGEFNGREFVANTEPKPLDYGPDYYAAVTFSNCEERISLGWMNNWDYANSRDLSAQPWNGSMTSARRLTIADGDLLQSFYPQTIQYKVPKDVDFQLRYPNGVVKFNREEDLIWIDRSELWSQSLTRFSVPAAGEISVEAIFDLGSVEISLNGKFVTFLLEAGSEVPNFELCHS